METDQTVKESLLYEKIAGKKVVCKICRRQCVIPSDSVGFCKTRKNIKGKLYTLEYGLASSIGIDPIEKKPFFHFWPGSRTLTMGSWSCTFVCPWCQNYGISKVEPKSKLSTIFTPKQFIQLALNNRCNGTSMSYSEPTTFLEFSIDVFKLAKKKKLYNTFVTNGYFSPESLEVLIKNGCDAFNIDIKGGKEAVKKYCGADVDFVWQNIVAAKKKKAWIEITTLVIPKVNDDDKSLNSIAKRIHDEVGDEVPWHVSGYYPCYKFTAPPTPVKTLEKAWQIGKNNELNFIYIGNIPGYQENTYCPDCRELLIERYGFSILNSNLTKNNTCQKCNRKIPIIGTVKKSTEGGFY
jgi:pyruvate formate lyase activating enzyme